jgi:2-iminobutanoate/2-iminopropanoate deaminase
MTMTQEQTKFRRLGDFSVGKWVGDILYLSGFVGVDPETQKVIQGYEDIPQAAADELRSGQASVDKMEGPIVAQAWVCFEQMKRVLESQDLTLEHVVHITHYMTSLATDFPAYNRLRNVYFPENPPTSTVVEVTALLPSPDVRLEVEARVAREVPTAIGHVADMR